MSQQIDLEYWREIRRAVAPPKAVIVGTGHHGSGYIAKVLSGSGVRCGHEGYWSLRAKPKNLMVDSSWLAVEDLPRYEGIVWHQIRNPLRVVTSFAETLYLYYNNSYGQLKRELTRPFTSDAVVDAMAVYVDLNAHCEEYATKRWKVETIDKKLILKLGKKLDLDLDRAAIKSALRDVPKNSNEHTKSRPLTWDELPNAPVKDELIEMTERYGYQGP